MKSKIIILFLSLFLSFQKSKAQKSNEKKTQLETAGYKGNVKRIEQGYYKANKKYGEIVQGGKIGPGSRTFLILYDDRGNKIEENTYKADGSLFGKITCKYDDRGNQIEMNGYNSQNRGGTTNYRIIWKYDEKGNMIETSTFKSDGSLYGKDSYKHNEKGRLIECIWYKSELEGKLEGKYICKYNELGYLIEKSNYDLKDEPKGKDTYIYDDKGNIIDHTHANQFANAIDKALLPDIYHYTYKYDDKGNILEKNTGFYKYTWTYDEKGNTTENNVYNTYGSLLRKFIMKYDDYANRIEHDHYKSNGKSACKFTWKYDYDQYGNWIRKTEFKNDKPRNITVRLIEYF